MATKTPSPINARAACEAILKEDRAYNIENKIWPSAVKVVDRLLARGLELSEAYEELYRELSHHPQALQVFFGLLLGAGAYENPGVLRKRREGRARLVEVNRKINVVANELAGLLSERSYLHNHSGFSCETHYHPVDVLHAAAASNYSYQHWVKEPLDNIRGQFDMKYWPLLNDFVQAIADDAMQAVPRPNDALTEAGTEGPRASLADSFKAFFAALDEQSKRNHGFLPSNFQLTDRSMASLMNCALDLGPDEPVDAAYVKRLRQRVRERNAGSL